MWTLPDGRLGVFIADASGHGIGPALVVSQARTLVRAICDIDPDPHEMLRRVNARMCADLEWGRFVTAFLAFLSPDGWLHWSSAGHGPAMVRKDPESPLEQLDPPVQPLGVVDEWAEDPPAPVKLGPAGSFVVISDGIFEAMNATGEQFGVERMKDCINTYRNRKSADVVDGLCQAVTSWQGPQEPLDDQTIVVVQRV
jgi:phosphoserine phosphatase